MKERQFNSGFTLIELVIVILVLAILAVVGSVKSVPLNRDAKLTITYSGN